MQTAGNLGFQGTSDGYYTAYEAESGKQLWQFNAGLGILGGPLRFSSGGKQYVSGLVGYGGSAAVTSDMLNVGWKFNAPPSPLLTFDLDGQARLAPPPPRAMPGHALVDPAAGRPSCWGEV